MGSPKNIPAIILAAGESTRMKQPKQLLPWGNSTLLGHTIGVAQKSNADEVYVVLGANARKIGREISKATTTVIINEDWRLGIGSSISRASHYLLNTGKTYRALLFMLCDQPLIDAAYLNEMLYAWGTANKKIIATAYGQGQGVPALFHKMYIPELMALEGDSGAKEVILRNSDAVLTLEPDGKQIDLDTFEAYQHLKNQTKL